MENIIRFSTTKRFIGTWNGNAVEIKDTKRDKSVFIKYGIKTEPEAEKIIMDTLVSLEEKPTIEINGNSEIEMLMNDFKNNPTPEKEKNLKLICFCMKKMEYVNKKLFGVKKIIEKMDELGIKIEKGYNPFETN